MSKREFDDFDEFAIDYRDVHNESIKISGTDSDYFSEYKIIELAKVEKEIGNGRILDFGCGDGNSSVYFRKYFEDAEIIGVDISKKSIEEAKKKKIEHSKFSSFDGINIPCEDNSVDIVFAAVVFHHIEFHMHSKILADIRRVLKKGGRLYIFEHNPNNPMTRKIVRDCPFDKDAVLLKPNYSKSILKESNFEDVSIKYKIFIPRIKLFKNLLGVEEYFEWLPIGAQYYVKGIK